MAIIVYDVALYTTDHMYDWGQCEWRKYLNSLTNIKYRDLNYHSVDLQQVVDPLNTWFDVDVEPLTADSFPFVIYRKLDTQDIGHTTLVLHRTLEELKNDTTLINFTP